MKVTQLRRLFLALFISQAVSVSISPFNPPMAEATSHPYPWKSWHELKDPISLEPVNGARYYHFKLDDGTVGQLVVAYMKGKKWRLRPFLAEKTAPTSTLGKQQMASAAINGGFFNLTNGQSASYVVMDGVTVADPRTNKALIENPKLGPFLEQIFNRSELRMLEKKKGETFLQIAAHNDPLPTGSKIIDSLQAGPQLLPSLRSEEEAFLRKQADGTYADSIGCKKPAARSAVGLTPDGYAILVAINGKGQDPESSGLTLEELAALMRSFGCREALNLDGGSSTSFFLRLQGQRPGEGTSVSGKTPETLVKSTLMLYPQ